MKPLLIALLLAVPAAQDVAAKKEKIGEILKFLSEEKKGAGGDKAKEAELLKLYRPLMDEARRLVAEIAGPDPAKQGALFEELMAKHIPDELAAEKIASNERRASAALMRINSVQAMFRAQDLDGDGKPNYWVGDISALYRLRRKGVDEAMYIDAETARADARPSLPLDEPGAPPTAPGLRLIRAGSAQPSHGYLYLAFESYETKDGDTKKYDTGEGRNPAKYGVCAYPSEYGRSGKLTYIRSEASSPFMWRKDTDGKPPSAFPSDPARAGWTPYE